MTFSEDHVEMHELISRRLDEDLSDIEGQRLDAHLRTCLPCQRLADEMNIAITQLRASSPQRLSPERRLRIEKDLEQDGYMNTRLPLGQRISRFLVSLTETPPRLAWGISSLMVIVGVGLVLYSGQTPERRSRSISSTSRAPERLLEKGAAPEQTIPSISSTHRPSTHGSDEAHKSAYKHWHLYYDQHRLPDFIDGVRIGRVSEKTEHIAYLGNGSIVWPGDRLSLQVLRGPEWTSVWAILVASDGAKRVLDRERSSSEAISYEHFKLSDRSISYRLLLVVTPRPIDIELAVKKCLSASPNALCYTVRFELEAQKPGPPQPPNHQDNK